MNHKEIIAEYNKDWFSELRDKVEQTLSNNKYRKYIIKNLKNKKHFYFKPIFITSKRGNKYILQIATKGLKDFKKNGLMFLLYMYYRLKDGIHVVMAYKRTPFCFNSYFTFYTSHLFNRYRERELKDTHISKMATIIECMKWNNTLIHKDIDSEKYPNSIFCVSPFGVILGIDLGNENRLLKTYLPFKMLKGNQNRDKEKLRNFVLEYIDKHQ